MESYKMLIDGQWVDSENGESFEVINPATEEPFATAPRATKGQVQQALEAAERAFHPWSALSPEQRGVFLWKASHILASRKEMIGGLMTREQGKPLKEAVGEIEKAVEMLQYFAEEGKRAYGNIIANADPMDQSLVVKQPVGVVAALSTWNYPVELTGWKAAASLAAGCTIVAKPPTLTPLSPLEFWRCLLDAGVPDGVINAVTGPGEAVGRELVANPISKKVAFTGSLEVGLKIQEQCKNTIKKISLELGGHCPLIVSRNCDLPKAVKGAVRRSFRNMGQICIAINRIYVHKDIHDRFLEAFSLETQKLTMGNGLKNPESDLGAMASQDGLEKSMYHVQDAVSKGATVVTGGKRPEGPQYEKGYFFEPTILSRCDHRMLIMTEETFGPVVGVMAFETLAEAIRLANDTPYGLAAYGFTNDLHEMGKISRELEAGSVAINNVDAGIMNAPYGGWKQSGVGYEHGHEGLEEYLKLKHIRIRYQEP
jgi:succinate-semialdehyde dehydrogenase/glutarate-semialdehyde dehydrogenase